jgi:hypothetical protein
VWPFQQAPVPPAQTPAPADLRPIDRDERAPRPRWMRVLVVFLRLLAAVWLVRGLFAWALILGLSGAEGAFEAMDLPLQVSAVAFAVLYCLAAVGLWLPSSWGAVLWLIVTLVETTLPILAPGAFPAFGAAHVSMLALIGVYLLLTWLSVREAQQFNQTIH